MNENSVYSILEDPLFEQNQLSPDDLQALREASKRRHPSRNPETVALLRARHELGAPALNNLVHVNFSVEA